MRHVSQWLVGDATRLSVVGKVPRYTSLISQLTRPLVYLHSFDTPGGGDVTRLSLVDQVPQYRSQKRQLPRPL